MCSEEIITFTKDLKDYALAYNPWYDIGAELIGFLPVDRLNQIPSYSIDWVGVNTIKTTEQMEDAKSLIILGYHASDDIYEAIIKK